MRRPTVVAWLGALALLLPPAVPLSSGGGLVLPVFPLRKSIKLPMESVWLNLYEPRYLALIDAVNASSTKCFGAVFVGQTPHVVPGGVGPATPLLERGAVGVVCRLLETAERAADPEGNTRRRVATRSVAVGRFRVDEVLDRGFGPLQGEDSEGSDHGPARNDTRHLIVRGTPLEDDPCAATPDRAASERALWDSLCWVQDASDAAAELSPLSSSTSWLPGADGLAGTPAAAFAPDTDDATTQEWWARHLDEESRNFVRQSSTRAYDPVVATDLADGIGLGAWPTMRGLVLGTGTAVDGEQQDRDQQQQRQELFSFAALQALDSLPMPERAELLRSTDTLARLERCRGELSGLGAWWTAARVVWRTVTGAGVRPSSTSPVREK